VIFKTFALLLARPVGEEAIVNVNGEYGDQHVHRDAERGHAAQQSNEQSQAAEKFGANRKEGQRRWDVHHLGEEVHGPGEAVAAEPSQHFLRAVGEEHYAQHQADHGVGVIIGS
jgi:hypothetical protein